MRKRFIQGLIVGTCLAGSVWSGSVIAQSPPRPQGTCLPDQGYEDGPECWHLLYIDGQVGDPTYDQYRAEFGDPNGCIQLFVTDDAASPISPTIFTTDLCLLTTADYENMFEAIADELIGTTPATVIYVPSVK